MFLISSKPHARLLQTKRFFKAKKKLGNFDLSQGELKEVRKLKF